jgi:glycosyltransferase involved in cell wall biosynthesis
MPKRRPADGVQEALGSQRVPTPSWSRPSHPSLLSVVIPTYNSKGRLADQLSALSLQDFAGDFEVILADNGSTDGTPQDALLWRDRLRLRVVDASSRQDAGYARNLGAASAQGDLIVCTDHDDVASPGWLRALADAAPHADLVGGPLEHTLLNSPEVLATRHWPHPASTPSTVGSFLPTAFTTNLAIWTEVFRAIGGFREGYGASSDVDLCWRAQLGSFKLGFAPNAIMHYRFRKRMLELCRQQYQYGQGNAHLYADYRKFGMPRNLLSGIWAWAQLFLRIPLLALPSRRVRWTGDVAFRLGRLVGSVKWRCLYL